MCVSDYVRSCPGSSNQPGSKIASAIYEITPADTACADSIITVVQKDQVFECTYDSNHFCTRHNKLGVMMNIPSKVWSDRGGGRGFGCVKSKREVLACIQTNKEPAKTSLQSWLKKTNHRAAKGGSDAIGPIFLKQDLARD